MPKNKNVIVGAYLQSWHDSCYYHFWEWFSFAGVKVGTAIAYILCNF